MDIYRIVDRNGQSHGCRKCKSENEARYRAEGRKPRRGEERTTNPDKIVSAEPLRRMIGWASQAHGGMRYLAQAFAGYAGTDPYTVERYIWRVWSGQRRRITIDTADDWCLFLGTTLAIEWPELYQEEAS